MKQLHVLEHELIVERREVQELRADLESCRLEKRNVQRTLESTLDEKKKLSDKINQLAIIGMISLNYSTLISLFFNSLYYFCRE